MRHRLDGWLRGALLCCAMLWQLLPASAFAATAEQPLAQAIDGALREEGLQGAVWSTLKDGAIVSGSAGIRDARHRQPLRPDDRVHVGSVAKTVLATGVLRLVSERRFALDTPLSQLLPGVAIDNPWQASDPLRVRHLLDHTAGLDDARLSQVFSLRPRADTPLGQAFAGHGPLRVRSRPGSRHSYSNSGYTLLGMVIEATTRSRYEAWLDRHLLQPLGMHDSTFAFTRQDGSHADPRLAMGHFENGATQAAVPMYTRPAGQFTTTAADMARFARFLMSGGRLDGQPFIDASLLRSMGQPHGTEAAVAGLRVGYGLGLATRDRHGAVGACHGGSTVGYRAMFCLFPHQGRAFFVAVNADIEGADYGRIDRLLVRNLGVESRATSSAAPVAIDASAWEGFYVPAPNRFASFAWLDSTLNFVHVRGEAGGLRFSPFQSPALHLMPVGGALWRAPDRTIASHALLSLPDGTRAISTGLQSYQQTSLLALLPRWASLVAGLCGVAWLLVSGVLGLLARGDRLRRPTFVPLLGIVALLLPVPFFFRQSFLELGDLTLASGLLAAVTLLLPLSMLFGLLRAVARRPWTGRATADAVAMAAVLQWTLVLATWGLLPLRLWA